MKIKLTLALFCSLLMMFFFNCKNTSSSQKWSSETEAEYIEKGKQIASATFTALSQQLQKAVKEGGIPNAIEYCNVAAYPITDSLSQIHKATIRRTSLKYRNPNNEPSEREQKVLKDYTKKAAANEPLQPMAQLLDNNKVAFYAPIQVNDFCLKCHGTVGESLATEDYALIKKYYPKDQAIGYKSGDLRGMWSIQFN